MSRSEPTRLFMTTDAVGGVWQYALDLSRALAAARVSSTLAVLGPQPTTRQAADAAEIAGLRLVETGLSLDWTADSAEEVVGAGHAIAALATQARADLVHLNSPALAAEVRFGVPVVAMCHSCVATWWNAVRREPIPPDFAWRTDLVRRGYAAADALIAPTAAFAEATARTYGLERAPSVVHNGRTFCPARSPADGPKRSFVFTAGRLWDEGKNLAALDRAAARLPAPVLAAGPTQGPHGATVTLVHARPLGTLSGDEIGGYLAAGPVFASLALYEPFGLAVLEAAQAGCPLVLSDIATFRELWDGAAVFVSPHDDDALASALENLLGDGAERARLGAKARERAARYTVEAMAAGVLATYRALLAGRASPALAEAAA